MTSSGSWLPEQPGWLPVWMLFVSFLSLFNTLQSYSTLYLTSRLYPNAAPLRPQPPKSPYPSPSPASLYGSPLAGQVTPLSSRTFGTWTLLTAVVRYYCAYRLDDPDFYALAFATYVVAFAHFGSELWWYGTTSVKSGVWTTIGVAAGTMVWMGLQRGFYVGE